MVRRKRSRWSKCGIIEYERSWAKKKLIEKLESKLVYAINCWRLRHATNTDRFGNDDNSVAKLAALTHTQSKREEKEKKC